MMRLYSLGDIKFFVESNEMRLSSFGWAFAFVFLERS